MSYSKTRNFTVELIAPLEAEDLVIQAAPEASPPKWHLAHTTWFFEKFILEALKPSRKPFHPKYDYLFNSYYEAVGERHPRPSRGILSRPSTAEILRYRRAIDEEMGALLQDPPTEARALLEKRVPIGLAHEEQHQELLLMDLQLNFSKNPLKPVYLPRAPATTQTSARPLKFVASEGGLHEFGFAGDGFAFDNERPRHKMFIPPFLWGDRLVTSGEYGAFIDDGGYRRPELWLSDGWVHAQAQGWQHPAYWERIEGAWHNFGLHGLEKLDPAAPVAHVSAYEADAFARWSNKRLLTEWEWELISKDYPLQGRFLDLGCLSPRAAAPDDRQIYGDVWTLTSSAYAPYPGFKPEKGALGEYNGKFMANQIVLRGGSCLTPHGHVRATYRNFFRMSDRWSAQGIRLAE